MHIKTEQLKLDMRFSKDVFFDDGQCLLLAAGNAIGNRELRALKQWKIPFVVTDGKILEKHEDIELETLETIDEELGEVEDITNTIYIEGSQLSQENLSLISKMISFTLPEDVKKGMAYKEYQSVLEYLNNLFVKIKEDTLSGLSPIVEEAKKIIKIANEVPQDAVMLLLAGSNKSSDGGAEVLNTTLLVALLFPFMSLDDAWKQDIILASLLHKVGLLKMPTSITKKDGTLSDADVQILNTHIAYAYKCAVHDLGCSERVGSIIKQQYECWDGKGYPDGLSGDSIALGARFISVADKFIENLTKKGQKKPIMSHEAIKHLLSDNSHKLDPSVVKMVVQVLGFYPVGSVVLLNDGSVCKVIKAASDAPLRPIVEVLLSETGKIAKEAQKTTIDLKVTKEKCILRAIDSQLSLQ